MNEPQDTQLLVIGAGPGGYTAAFHAADLGMQVSLVDTEAAPGGVCLYRGCIPSKTLLHAAKIISEARQARDLGIIFGSPQIDHNKLRQWKNSVVAKLTGGLGQLTKQRNITFIQGKAAFTDSHTIKVQKTDGSLRNIRFEHAILASGSRPVPLPNLPDSPHILNAATALEIAKIPKSLLVIGGGYIGLEMGTVYAELGSDVSIVEITSGLLPGADRDLTAILEKRLKSLFKSIMLNTKTVKIETASHGMKVTFDSPGGKTSHQEYEKVLVSVGRKPNSDHIGLEHTKVKIDEGGFVKVDAQRRTTDPAIYAVGDITGDPMLAHKASREGRVAVDTIAGKKAAFEPKAIPAVVFTDPEIAWCGLTETQAVQKNIEIKVAKFPWSASGRAMTLNRTDGLTKLIVDPLTQKILGVALAGTGAGELIAEGVLAIEMGAMASDLQRSIHPHPTLSETVMEAAESFFGHATHIYRPRKEAKM